MVHPSISPVELETGAKEGYFVVNLSLKQTFEEASEFFFPKNTNRSKQMILVI
jgi:hypothetical protein